MNTPDLSVIIPCYPNMDPLPNCLQSIRNQTLKNIEVIVVTDGIEDKTPESKILEEFSDLNLRFIHNSHNRSLIQTRIVGMMHATGRYVMNIDHDDAVEEVFAKAIELADKHDADMVGIPMSRRNKKRYNAFLTNNTDIMLRCYYKIQHYFGNIANYIIKQSVVKKALRQLDIPQMVYLNYAEDNVFLVAFCSVSEKLIEDPTLGKYLYTRNPDSITQRSAKTVFPRPTVQIALARKIIENYSKKYHVSREDVGWNNDMPLKSFSEGDRATI